MHGLTQSVYWSPSQMMSSVVCMEVPYYLGELTEKNSEDDKIQVLKASQVKLNEFISFCESMELVPQEEIDLSVQGGTNAPANQRARKVFEAFGIAELVQMPLDETGHCKGFGFVQFARLEDAKSAQTLNGQLEIAGRTIKVSAVIDQMGLQNVGKITSDLDDDERGGLSFTTQSRALLMAKLDRSGIVSRQWVIIQ